ncbi:MAG: hypothetical protein V2A70_07405 [Candidatus Omnitrophota bacterium]
MMGRYLFENDRVHFWHTQGQGVMSWEEFCGSDMPKDRQAHILLAAEEGAGAFVRVREIKAVFAAGRIITLVPYAQALGVFLMERNYLDPGKIGMVLDDLGERFLLTVLSGTQVLAARIVPSLDLDKVTDEMRRTQKSIGDRKGDRSWCVLSNHEALVKFLQASGMEAEVNFFETFLPAMQVLGRVKFAQNMTTPEEVAGKKRREHWLAFIGSLTLGVLVAAAGFAYYAQQRALGHEMDARHQTLRQESIQAQEELKQFSVSRYQDRARRLPSMNLALNMDDLIRSLLTGMRIESVIFERDDAFQQHIAADIIFADGQFMPWDGFGIWQKVSTTPRLGPGYSGLRILADRG